VIAPRTTTDAHANGTTLDESLLGLIPAEHETKPIPAAAFLYVIGEVAKGGAVHFEPAVIAGVSGHGLTKLRPGRRLEYSAGLERDEVACEVGVKAAEQFKVHAGDTLLLRDEGRQASCKVFAVVTTGGAEDTQIFTKLGAAQSLAGLPGRISLIQLSVTGTPDSINAFISSLGRRLPGAEVGMSNVAIERKNDVGLMKALGGSVDRVVNLFLAEAILLGVAGGVIGSALGLLTSVWLGQAVFGVAAQPRWIVYPVSVALTVIVSIASAFPLRRLASVRPASVFRGEE